MTEEKLNEIRAIMYRDDCCDRMVPSDVREMVGEIKRLRQRVKDLEKENAMLFSKCVS